jgi:small subunit ribosomal protein S6
MKDYELLYIVSGGLTEADATKVTDEVGSALLKLDGKATDENVWGRRSLAYPIGKDDHGWYVVTRFAMDPAKLNEFSQALNLNRQIIRTVLVKGDEVPTPEEVKKAQAATEEAEKAEAEERAAAKKAPGVKARAGAAPKIEVPETMKKSAPKPGAKPAATEPVKPEEPAATPVDEAERKQQLEEKLGEILKD